MALWIIFTVMVAVIGITGLICGFKENNDAAGMATVGTFFSAVALFSIIVLISEKTSELQPKAIDVYNNKTTLQITYQDSIPIDTVVVFKKEFKTK